MIVVQSNEKINSIKVEKKVNDVLKDLYKKEKSYQSIYLKLNSFVSNALFLYYSLKKYLLITVNHFDHYNLAKFLIPILKQLIQNEFTVKELFEFSNNISNQDSSLFMARTDIDTLFTNIPSEKN